MYDCKRFLDELVIRCHIHTLIAANFLDYTCSRYKSMYTWLRFRFSLSFHVLSNVTRQDITENLQNQINAKHLLFECSFINRLIQTKINYIFHELHSLVRDTFLNVSGSLLALFLLLYYYFLKHLILCIYNQFVNTVSVVCDIPSFLNLIFSLDISGITC